MIENIFDYFKVPTEEDVKEILNPIQENIKKVNFICKERAGLDALFDTRGSNLSYWTREFNNRFFDFIINYEIMMNYYKSGIPDNNWFISPGKNGETVSYFPEFEEKHHANLYLFGFYVDSLYVRYFGLIDTLYHILDEYYELEAGDSLGFIGRVLKGINKENQLLGQYLENIKSDTRYIKVNEFRNNQVHNFRVNQVSPELSPKENLPDGRIIQRITVGSYTTTSEFVCNINDGIELLSEIVEQINNHLGEL